MLQNPCTFNYLSKILEAHLIMSRLVLIQPHAFLSTEEENPTGAEWRACFLMTSRSIHLISAYIYLYIIEQ